MVLRVRVVVVGSLLLVFSSVACSTSTLARDDLAASPSDGGASDLSIAIDRDLADTAGDAGCVPAPIAAGLTVDFRGWLDAHGYGGDDFARDDLAGGSVGGRTCAGQALAHDPVVFVHGNSDRAFGVNGPLTGWTASIAYFASHGYTSAELYATTWGPADTALATAQTHSMENVRRTRRFFDAVLAYTGATRLDIIAHSMGVTLARRAILGGDFRGADLGAPLSASVDAFVGISGANRGLTNCYLTSTLPTCDASTGLFPGTLVGTTIVGRSALLEELDGASGYEGARRYAVFSTADELIGYGGLVYGEYTSRIPGQTGEQISATQSHNETKDLTAAAQLSMVQ